MAEMRPKSSGISIPSTQELRFDTPEAQAPHPPARVPELDALRGLAAVAVVVYHSRPPRLPWGWAAVDLFFVLSGYLITTIILKHGKTCGFLPKFYARRALRVWPIYYLATFILVALSPILPRLFHWHAFPYHLTFTQSIRLYVSDTTPWWTLYMGHAWTLAVEEQFYLLWPALLLLTGCGRKRTMVVAVLAAAGSVWLRSGGMNLTLLGARGDGLTLGGFMAALLIDAPFVERRRGALTATFAATAVISAVAVVAAWRIYGMGKWSAVPPRQGFSILAFNGVFFGLIGLVVCQAGRPWLFGLRWGPLRQIGLISYGLYLLHIPVIALSGDLARAFGLRGQPLWREGLTTALCFAVAWASWRWIEAPALSLKSRFEYEPLPTARRHPASRLWKDRARSEPELSVVRGPSGGSQSPHQRHFDSVL